VAFLQVYFFVWSEWERVAAFGAAFFVCGYAMKWNKQRQIHTGILHFVHDDGFEGDGLGGNGLWGETAWDEGRYDEGNT
jgi:hypothetical protein